MNGGSGITIPVQKPLLRKPTRDPDTPNRNRRRHHDPGNVIIFRKGDVCELVMPTRGIERVALGPGKTGVRKDPMDEAAKTPVNTGL